MIYPCTSEILFNSPCQYGGTVDTEKHAYSERKLGDTYYRYHYLDWERSKKENILITTNMKRELGKHLLKLRSDGDKSKWIIPMLHSLGYNPDA